MALSKAADVAGTVSNLSVYFGQQAALENINMQIHRRRINVLSGPSGSGKTTLLRALNRLNDEYQHSRTRGEITLCVADKPLSVNQLKTTELPYLRRKVGMVFQHPQLLPGSVAQNLLLPLKVVGNLQGEAALKQMQQALSRRHCGMRSKIACRHRPQPYPAGNSSAFAWPAPWFLSRISYCSMSLPLHSIPKLLHKLKP